MIKKAMVLCHTIFHDSFRIYPEPTEHQDAAKFFLRYIIEVGSGEGQGLLFWTSQQVMENISENLPNQGHPFFPAQLLLALKNLIYTPDSRVENLNEGVIIIADVLSSVVDEVILVSNMQKKVRLATDFYQKYEKTSKQWKEKDLPFIIKDTTQLKTDLKGIDENTYNNICSYLKQK